MTATLAALVSHPIQYQAPLFRELDGREDVDLFVYFCNDHGVEPSYDEGFDERVKFDVGLLSGYEYSFLNNWTEGMASSLPIGHANPAIIREILAHDFDLLWVHGWADLTNWLAVATANATSTDVLIRGDSNGIQAQWQGAEAIRDTLLRILFKGVDKYGAIGTLNEQFYLDRGASKSNIYQTPYTVDNQWFQDRKPPSDKIPSLRKEFGLDPDLPTVLFVGKLIERKQPLFLLRAFHNAISDDAQLVYVGSGELKEKIETSAKRLGISEHVYTPGFVKQEHLPFYYTMADVFCLPSSDEPWGLVINEALNFGLPIIASDAVGAAPDLVTDNGIVFDAFNSGSLANALEQVLFDEELRKEMSEVSKQLAADWTLERTADGIVRAALDASKER